MIVTKRLKQFDREWKYKPVKDVKLYWLNTSDDECINEFLDYCLVWCVKKFGELDGLDIPQIEWDWKHDDLYPDKLLGVYDIRDNEIIISISGHRTFYNLAKTAVHEYIHYLQPKVGNWYDRHYRKYGYDNHPYEKEAYYLSELYYVECARWVMHQMSLNKNSRIHHV